MIYFSCPGCQKLGEAADGFAGQIVTCPSCLAQMQVPDASTTTATTGSQNLLNQVPEDGKVRFLCPRCRKRQRAGKEAVGSVTVCRRCRQRMYVPTVNEPGAPLVLAQRIKDGKKEPSAYYYAKNGVPCGPVQGDLLRKMAKTGVLLPTDLIWKKGMSEWMPAARLHGLFPRNPKVPPPVPNPEPSTSSAEWVPTDSPPAPAAAPQPELPAGPLKAADLIARAMVHAEKRETGQALALLDQVLRMEPRNAQAFASRAVVRGQLMGEHRRAIADLDEAIRFAPEEAVLYEFRGLYNRALGERVRAMEDASRAAELAKRRPSQIVMKLGAR